MQRLLLILLVLAIPSSPSRWFQDPDIVCPKITVDCPEEVEAGKPIKFKATVKGAKPVREISYNWTVDKGKIVFGQGTATIEVDLGGQDCKGVTATVEVNGFDLSCSRVGSCSACAR